MAFLQISPRISVLPIIHGSGDFAIEVRRKIIAEAFDCIAVPLPESFRAGVEAGIDQLPGITVAVQEEPASFTEAGRAMSYVPIDPCQGVVAAIRCALEERIPRAYIDLETGVFEPLKAAFPDPYALKQLSVGAFAAAVLPALPRLPDGQPIDRVVAMAHRLRELERHHRSILFVCSLLDWPWVKDAYFRKTEFSAADESIEEPSLYAVAPKTLLFVLGELPFITALYERARAELECDNNLSIDGVKELVLRARENYRAEFGKQAREISPHLLSVYLRYVRNLSLIERRMTPDLFTLVTAAQQIAGDQFALHLAETARQYPAGPPSFDTIEMGVRDARLPDGSIVRLKSRLPGPPLIWRACALKPRPDKRRKDAWQMRWNPYMQCSWPPEDSVVERFRTHVKDQALAALGADLARSEKFSTSLYDGLDLRETLRNWHTGDLYVKVLPPTRGQLDCVVMLFDSPADPRDYPWRTTWTAEHHDESTLALFASDFRNELVGPGIGRATYGGALFLFPPRPIADIWNDARLNFTTTLEERILAAACLHSHERRIALLSAAPPGAGWRRLARRYGRKFVHVPLGRFGQATIAQLRTVHVLNGRQVRSYAADFIRRA